MYVTKCVFQCGEIIVSLAEWKYGCDFLADEHWPKSRNRLPENLAFAEPTEAANAHNPIRYVGPLGRKKYNYKCQLCDYTNNRVFNFKRHLRRHSDIASQCDICGGYFRWLDKHKKKHLKF